MKQMIFIKTRIHRKREPLAGPVRPGVPNWIEFAGEHAPFIPPSYQAEVPEPVKITPRAETPERPDPLGYMMPRLPMGVPLTPETEQALAYKWMQWAQRKAGYAV